MSGRKKLIHPVGLALFILMFIVGPARDASAQSTWQKMKLQFLEQACKGGDQNSCRQLAQLKQKLAQQGQAPQGQQLPQGTTPAPGQNPPQPASVAPNASGVPQETAEPWTPPAENDAGGKPVALDPMKLPDVVGVHVGMTAQEALAALHKTYPADLYQGKTASYWPSTEKPSYGYNVLSRDSQNSKHVTLHFTAPPGPQLVWEIDRNNWSMHINRGTLLAALREKYGKETAAYSGSDPATNDATISELVWLYDEHGTRLAMPPLSVFDNQAYRLFQCVAAGTGEPEMPKDADWGKGLNDWCVHHLVVLTVRIDPLDIVENYSTTMKDLPLALRTSQAAAAWLRDVAQKQHQEDLEKSKEKKPVL